MKTEQQIVKPEQTEDKSGTLSTIVDGIVSKFHHWFTPEQQPSAVGLSIKFLVDDSSEKSGNEPFRPYFD